MCPLLQILKRVSGGSACFLAAIRWTAALGSGSMYGPSSRGWVGRGLKEL